MLFRSLVLIAVGFALVVGGMAARADGNSRMTGFGPSQTGPAVVLADDNPGPFTP